MPLDRYWVMTTGGCVLLWSWCPFLVVLKRHHQDNHSFQASAFDPRTSRQTEAGTCPAGLHCSTLHRQGGYPKANGNRSQPACRFCVVSESHVAKCV